MLRFLLVCICLLTACKGGGEPGGDPGKKPGALTEAPAFEKASATLALLPAETVGLALAVDPMDLINRLGREDVVKAIPELYNEAATEIRKELGFDLLDPAKWTEVGIDAHASAGVFFAGPEMVAGFFATVGDATKLTAFIQKMAGERLETRAVGDAKVHWVGRGDPTILIRGNLMVALVGRGVSARAWAAHLATLPAAQALGTDKEFTASMASLKFGRDASGYLHVPRLIELIIDDMTGRVDNSQLDRFIEAARQRGDTELAEKLNENRREGGGGSRSDQMMMGALKGVLFGGLGPLVGGARVEDDAIRLRLKMPLGENALPRRVLTRSPGANPITTLAGPDFMFLLGARANIEAATALIRSIALAVGEADDLERGLQQTRTELGINLEDDVIKALSGELGFAMLDQDPKIKGEQRLGLTGFAGVADEGKLKAAVDGAAKHPMLGQVFTANEGGYIIKNEWKPVTAVLGPRLLVTTDPTAVKRLPGDAAPADLSSSLAAVLRMDGASAVGAMDISRTAALTLLMRFDWDPPAPETQNRTPEIEAKIKEWEATQAEMKRAREEREARETAAFQRMVGPLGHLAAAAKLTDEGLEIEGGQFFRGTTVPQAFATLAREGAALSQQNREGSKPDHELYRKLGEIRSQIEALDQAALPVPVAPPGEVPPPGELQQALPPDDGKME